MVLRCTKDCLHYYHYHHDRVGSYGLLARTGILLLFVVGALKENIEMIDWLSA